jgi:hypothetical protein
LASFGWRSSSRGNLAEPAATVALTAYNTNGMDPDFRRSRNSVVVPAGLSWNMPECFLGGASGWLIGLILTWQPFGTEVTERLVLYPPRSCLHSTDKHLFLASNTDSHCAYNEGMALAVSFH